jgi:hypothetical protein
LCMAVHDGSLELDVVRVNDGATHPSKEVLI